MQRHRDEAGARAFALAAAVRDGHVEEHGSEPGRPAATITLMWRDTNPYNEVGIPSLTYGTASSTGGANVASGVDELTATARVYARAVLNLSGAGGT